MKPFRARAVSWVVVGALVLASLLFLPAAVQARPGGGEGYSGGGGGDGGGGGGDGGFVFLLIRLWIQFVIAYPQIGVPVTIAIIAIVVLRRRRKARAGPQTWDSAPKAPPGRRAVRDLDAIRDQDPEFSVVLFEDFAYALFARAHQARSSQRDLESLSPYLGPAARSHLAQRRPVGAPVSGVVVGAMRVVDLSIPTAAPTAAAATGAGASQVRVDLEFEANMTVGMAGAEHTHYVQERWRLARDVGVRSKPPEQARSFQCPNCGAPFGPEGGDRCEYCGQVVSGGRFDWSVEAIELIRIEERPPALTADVQEVGADWPTILHPSLNARWAELAREDPAVTQPALDARLRLIYGELNAAWSRRDLGGARPYVSDGLFDYLKYWVSAYERQGLRNVLEGMRIVEWKTVKVLRDRHFDSLAVRLWGSGRDYTVRQATGDVVSGDPKHDRVYSEYWTLIRGAGVRGAPRGDKSCPNCGAPLDVNMAGQCEHCGAKITSGEFDWVLSKIEQDDSYTG